MDVFKWKLVSISEKKNVKVKLYTYSGHFNCNQADNDSTQ